MGLLAEEALDDLLDLRHARLATDQDDFVDVARLRPASVRACCIGGIVRFTRSSTSCSSFARVSERFRCFDRLIGGDEGEIDSVCITVDSSIFAFRGFLQPCSAIGSWRGRSPGRA